MHSKGADLVIEASGHDSSLAAVLDYVRIGGRVTFVGISIGRKVPVEPPAPGSIPISARQTPPCRLSGWREPEAFWHLKFKRW